MNERYDAKTPAIAAATGQRHHCDVGHNEAVSNEGILNRRAARVRSVTPKLE
jgi:hypothetical protein